MKKYFPYFLLFLVNLFYGINFSVAKLVIPNTIEPLGLVLLRTLSGTLFFWGISFFTKYKNEILDKKDYLQILGIAFFGIAFNQLIFFQGLEYTTPINASIIMTSVPIIVLVFSWIYLKRKIEMMQTIGVLLGFIGSIGLIIYGKDLNNQLAKNPILGNILVLGNAVSYTYYLILAAPLLQKYHHVTILKWIYLIGFIFTIPFGLKQVIEVNWNQVSLIQGLTIGYILLFVSCLTYLFNQYALKKVPPTTVSVFIFLQPIVTVITSIYLELDSMNLSKWFFGSLIFIGVYFVIKKRR